jgi:hypothetical protein
MGYGSVRDFLGSWDAG